MSNKINPSQIIVVISVIVLLIGLSYLNTKRHTPEYGQGTILQTDKPDSEAAQVDEDSLLPKTQGQTSPTHTPEAKQPSGTLVQRGTLLTSDNPARGNLMLKTPTSNFYFQTSRDYSALLGKSVTVTANGTIEHFNLIDITLSK